jgi:hypothetical protein
MIKSFLAIAVIAISAQVSAQMMNVVYTPDFPTQDSTTHTTSSDVKEAK